MSGPDKQRNALLQAQAWLERQVAIASGQADMPDEGYADMFNAVLALIDDALQEPSGWQPIETAPKDGPVLLYFGNRTWFNSEHKPVSLDAMRDIVERTEVAFCKDGDICESGTGHSVFEEWRGFVNEPTHWMPLPTAPTPEVAG